MQAKQASRAAARARRRPRMQGHLGTPAHPITPSTGLDAEA
ncbi:hypothetical protein XCR_3487 [Xanthomonas campestris pv. raphani 756C]|nr:hypothetical protein XCR_3487 [Xanthomonas campestris pv. raphani 756C]